MTVTNAFDALFFAKSLQDTPPIPEKPPDESRPPTGRTIQELPLEQLTPYPNQPFRLHGEEQMDRLAESIRTHGVMQPLRARPYGAAYQIVSGHNRHAAAGRAGLTHVPVIVQDMTDDEAIIFLVESNLNGREHILPSERAWAYRLRAEAISRQGNRSDLTCGHDVHKLRSTDVIGEENDESGRQVRRYIRLTHLIVPLLELVDSEKLTLVAGVQLSHLTPESQEVIHAYCTEHRVYPNEKQAAALREKQEPLTADAVQAVLSGRPLKPPSKLALPYKRILKYFTPDATKKEMEKTILDALAYYREHHPSV